MSKAAVNILNKWSRLSTGHKLLSLASSIILTYLFVNFIYFSAFNPQDAIIYSRPADWRMGKDVRKKILAQFPDLPLANLTMSLEPDNARKGYAITSPGKAHFYGPKVNNSYQLKYTCHYSSIWQSGLRGQLQFKPSFIEVRDCRPVNAITPF